MERVFFVSNYCLKFIKMDFLPTAKFFKSLGHPTRVKMIYILRENKNLDFLSLAKNFPYSHPTLSKHLSFLTRSGVVGKTKKQKDGKVLFRVQEEVIVQMMKNFSSKKKL